MAKQLHSGLAALIVMSAGVVAAPSVSANVSAKTSDRPTEITHASAVHKQSRISQCNSLITVVNDGSRQVSALRGQESSISTLTTLANTLNSLSRRIGSVRVPDTTLQRYRNGFARLYGNLARTSSQIGTALTTFQAIQRQDPSLRDPDELQQIQTQLAEAMRNNEQATVQERRLKSAFMNYCQTGRQG
ncbi:MAG: hypothetical protein AAGF75_02615 [Cyanobacteria bacterium P01_H01_bin.130]